jgi:hypothetical protein
VNELGLGGPRVLGEGTLSDAEDLVARRESSHVRAHLVDYACELEAAHGVARTAESGD